MREDVAQAVAHVGLGGHGVAVDVQHIQIQALQPPQILQPVQPLDLVGLQVQSAQIGVLQAETVREEIVGNVQHLETSQMLEAVQRLNAVVGQVQHHQLGGQFQRQRLDEVEAGEQHSGVAEQANAVVKVRTVQTFVAQIHALHCLRGHRVSQLALLP
eukprot:scaffold8015_cov277-Pinguiococcus_pyrenoidosus.AAC.4